MKDVSIVKHWTESIELYDSTQLYIIAKFRAMRLETAGPWPSVAGVDSLRFTTTGGKEVK